MHLERRGSRGSWCRDKTGGSWVTRAWLPVHIMSLSGLSFLSCNLGVPQEGLWQVNQEADDGRRKGVLLKVNCCHQWEWGSGS